MKLAKSRVTKQCCIKRGGSFVYFTFTATMKDVNRTKNRVPPDDSVLLDCVNVSSVGCAVPATVKDRQPFGVKSVHEEFTYVCVCVSLSLTHTQIDVSSSIYAAIHYIHTNLKGLQHACYHCTYTSKVM